MCAIQVYGRIVAQRKGMFAWESVRFGLEFSHDCQLPAGLEPPVPSLQVIPCCRKFCPWHLTRFPRSIVPRHILFLAKQ